MKNTTNIISSLLEKAKITLSSKEGIGTEVEDTNFYLEAHLTLLESGYDYSFKLYKRLYSSDDTETLEPIPLSQKNQLRIAEVLLEAFPEDQEENYPHEVLDHYSEYGVSEADFISYSHK